MSIVADIRLTVLLAWSAIRRKFSVHVVAVSRVVCCRVSDAVRLACNGSSCARSAGRRVNGVSNADELAGRRDSISIDSPHDVRASYGS